MKYYVPAERYVTNVHADVFENYLYGLFYSPEEAWMFCLKVAEDVKVPHTTTVKEEDKIFKCKIKTEYSDGTYTEHFVMEADVFKYFRNQVSVRNYIDSLYGEFEETYGLDCCDDELGVWLDDVTEVAPGAFKLTFVADWNGGHDVRDLVYIYVEDEYYERGDNKDIDKYFDMEETE